MTIIKPMFRSFLILWVWVFALPVWAGTPLPVVWSAYLDASGQQDLAAVRALPATQWEATRGTVDYGFSSGAVWLRADLVLPEHGGHVLALSNPLLDELSFHVVRADAPVERVLGGFAHVDTSLDLAAYHNQVFGFEAAHAGQAVSLYLQAKATRPLILWPHVYTEKAFYQQSVTDRFILGAYFGLFLALSLYSLMFWSTTRDRVILDYLFLMAASGALQLHYFGVWYEWFLCGSPSLMRLFSVLFPMLSFVAVGVFTRTFLNLRQNHKLGDRLMLGCIVLSLFLLPVYGMLGMRPALLLANIFGAAMGVVGLLVGFATWRCGYRPARFYLLAMGVLVLGGMTHVLRSFDLLPTSPFSMYFFPLCAAFNVVMLAFALADKMKGLQQEHDRAQQDIIATERRMIEALRESEALLESRVHERTQQLEEALDLQRKQSQILQLTNQQLSSLDAERSAFLGIAAHDLKNPTSAIMGYADLLQERWSQWDDAKKLKRITSIRQLGQLIYEIIRNLLDIHAMEAGRYTLNPVRLDLGECLQHIVEVYRDRAESKHIGLSCTVETDLPVRVDKAALHQVLDNLLSNALKYSPPGTNVRLYAGISGCQVLLRVQDEGPGISDEDQKKLFRKFTRLSARPTAGEHSTGLGLSIVKYIVEASGGEIRCESRLGEGATFLLEFPLAT